MPSNPSSNLRDEPEHFHAAVGEEHDGWFDNLEDSGSILDSLSGSDEYDSMDLDDESSDDHSYEDSEADDDDEDDADVDDDDDDEDDEEEEGNGLEMSRDEEESCKQSGGGDCPICFRSWNSDGPHRICCIPCGHVYGRSCLEKWLQQHRKNSGKCPQCNRKFKQKEIINLYAQLTAVANDDLVGPSEEFSREGNVVREGGEQVQAQGEQQGWQLTKENWDMMCSRLHALSAKNEQLGNRLDAFEGRIFKMLEAFEVKYENLLDAMGERIRKNIDDNFKMLFELYKNPSDISKNPFDISSPSSGTAPPALDGKFEKLLDVLEETIGKKIDESFNKAFELYENSSGISSRNLGPAPSGS